MRNIPCQAAGRRGVRLTRQFWPAPGWRTMGAHLHLWWAWAYRGPRPGVSSLFPPSSRQVPVFAGEAPCQEWRAAPSEGRDRRGALLTGSFHGDRIAWRAEDGPPARAGAATPGCVTASTAGRRVRGNGAAAAARAVRFRAKAVGQAAAPRRRGSPPPQPPRDGYLSPVQRSPSAAPRPCPERGRGRTSGAPGGRALEAVEKVVTGHLDGLERFCELLVPPIHVRSA